MPGNTDVSAHNNTFVVRHVQPCTTCTSASIPTSRYTPVHLVGKDSTGCNHMLNVVQLKEPLQPQPSMHDQIRPSPCYGDFWHTAQGVTMCTALMQKSWDCSPVSIQNCHRGQVQVRRTAFVAGNRECVLGYAKKE